MKRKKILIVSLLCAFTATFTACGGRTQSNPRHIDTIPLTDCPRFMPDSAMHYIECQCGFGPRITASEASAQCAGYIEAKFRQFGAQVEEQHGMVTLYDGTRLQACNIIASILPECSDRILLCAHWDSRPWADNDPEEKNHHTPLLGANDGASGVAVMLELCRLMQQQSPSVGIDFVCFDAEDMGTPQWEEDRTESDESWCLGSQVWARKAAEQGYRARYGILLDMVGGRGSTFAREQISVRYAEPIVDMLWKLAAQIGFAHYFPRTEGGWLIDDHVYVNRIAQIPCIDIVPYFEDGPSSFGPTWHTIYDTPDNIDPNVLEAVGQSLTQLLYNEKTR